MLPVIKSNQWLQAPSRFPSLSNQAEHLQPFTMGYPDNRQKEGNGTFVYSTAPLTVHHSPHSTYLTNPGADTYQPYVQRPPPMYSAMFATPSLDNTTMYHSNYVQNDKHGPSSRFQLEPRSSLGNNDDEQNEISHQTSYDSYSGNQTVLPKSLKESDATSMYKKNAEVRKELNPVSNASALIESFDTIEGGLNDSLQKEQDHSSAKYTFLKCCRVSVRSIKHVLIVFVAISAVFTAGVQMYEHMPVDKLFPKGFSITRSKDNTTVQSQKFVLIPSQENTTIQNQEFSVTRSKNNTTIRNQTFRNTPTWITDLTIESASSATLMKRAVDLSDKNVLFNDRERMAQSKERSFSTSIMNDAKRINDAVSVNSVGNQDVKTVFGILKHSQDVQKVNDNLVLYSPRKVITGKYFNTYANDIKI